MTKQKDTMNFTKLKRVDLVARSRHIEKVRIGPSGDMFISKKAYDLMEQPEHIEVFYSPEDNALALRPVPEPSPDSYKVHVKPKDSVHLSCQQLIRLMPAGDYLYDPNLGAGDYIFIEEQQR